MTGVQTCALPIYSSDESHLYGVVSKDKNSALFVYAQLRPEITSHPKKILLRELDPASRYRVKVVTEFGAPAMMSITPPPWLKDGVEASGDALMKVGLPTPILRPENALLLEINAI